MKSKQISTSSASFAKGGSGNHMLPKTGVVPKKAGDMVTRGPMSKSPLKGGSGNHMLGKSGATPAKAC